MANACKTLRKPPTQKRALATYEAILEASAQVLTHEGLERFTTNHVAKRAGVSIGTLYQYFRNKDDLLHAITIRHTEKMLSLLEGEFAQMLEANLEDLIRGFVGAMIEAHRHERELHRALVLHLLTHDLSHLEAIDARAQQVVRLVLERFKDEIVVENLELASYVLVTTGQALANTAVVTRAGYDDDELKDEIVDVLLRYLRPHA